MALMNWLIGLLLLALPAASADPGRVWAHFENWALESPATTVRPAKPVMDLYADQLILEGLSPEQAERRKQLIVDDLRPKSRRHSTVYWDAMFKFGGGPDRPLRLLAEVVRDAPAGSALDVAMGNGRNGVYLASLGWKVTGYDISAQALAQARRRAAEMRAAIEMVQAGHREFDFGVERWDLIVLSYIVADGGDLETLFGARLWRSLRPGGCVVCEGNFCEPLVRRLFPQQLPGLRLERYSDSEGLRDSWAADDAPGRVIRAVLRKRP
jgi:SAM-dependent methyltransferase